MDVQSRIQLHINNKKGNKFNNRLAVSEEIFKSHNNFAIEEKFNIFNEINNKSSENILVSNSFMKKDMIPHFSNSENKNIKLKIDKKNINKHKNNFHKIDENDKKLIIIDNKTYSLEAIKLLIEENNQLKLDLSEYNNFALETKYRELLIDYQKIQTQNNKLIEENETLKNENDEIKKESSNYKNKYNLIIKEQKKTKSLLEDISLKYNSNISFQDEIESLKIKIENLIKENEELKSKIEENQKSKLDENIDCYKNNLIDKQKENLELKELIKNKEDVIKKNLDDIKLLKEKILIFENKISEEIEKNNILTNRYDSLNNNYNLLKDQNFKIETTKNEINKENILNLEKINALKESNENYMREINDIKLMNEELKNKYNEEIKKSDEKNKINDNSFKNEINKYQKEIEILKNEIENYKIKLEQKDNENINLLSLNKEINSKLNDLAKIERNKNEEFEKFKLEKEDEIKALKTQIKNLKEEFMNSNEKNNNKIIELDNKIKSLSHKNNSLLNNFKEMILENEKISQVYQNGLEKLRSIKFLNSDLDKNTKIFSKDGLIEPMNIIDFIENCIEEIINLKNENYILKNNICDLDLKLNLKKEQINDCQKENYNLKKIIENYSSDFDNKNKILYKIKEKANEFEKLLKKENNDKKFLLSILQRILKLYPNSKILNSLNEAFEDEFSSAVMDENENLFNIILKEIQLFENYIIDLKDKQLNISNIEEKKNINNNIIINNNTNNIESKVSNYNIKNMIDKLYLKNLYKKDNIE